MIKNIPAVDGIKENSPEHAGPHGGKEWVLLVQIATIQMI